MSFRKKPVIHMNSRVTVRIMHPVAEKHGDDQLEYQVTRLKAEKEAAEKDEKEAAEKEAADICEATKALEAAEAEVEARRAYLDGLQAQAAERRADLDGLKERWSRVRAILNWRPSEQNQ